MKASKNCLELIKKFEGFRSEPYLCPAGVPTIGYGSTYYNDGRKVKMSDSPISEAAATLLLSEVVDSFARDVDKTVSGLSQNQFDACVSFAYNVGIGAFRTSTLVKRIKANPCDPDIAFQFSRWNKGGGRVLSGLVKRRKEEAELYFR